MNPNFYMTKSKYNGSYKMYSNCDVREHECNSSILYHKVVLLKSPFFLYVILSIFSIQEGMHAFRNHLPLLLSKSKFIFRTLLPGRVLKILVYFQDRS